MELDVFNQQLEDLPAYRTWEAAARERDRLRELRPPEMSWNNREHLELQMTCLDADKQQIQARHGLAVAVAEQNDDFLPLTHRLGLVAVFDTDTSSLVQQTTDRRYMQLRRRSASYSVYDTHDTNILQRPVTYALKLGNELERFRTMLHRLEPLQLAVSRVRHVRNYHEYENMYAHEVVVTGELEDPTAALPLEPPKIEEQDGVKKLAYTIPYTLGPITDVRVAVGCGKPDEQETPYNLFPSILRQTADELAAAVDIPDISKLLGHTAAIYEIHFGESAVARSVHAAEVAKEVFVDNERRRIAVSRQRRDSYRRKW